MRVFTDRLKTSVRALVAAIDWAAQRARARGEPEFGDAAGGARGDAGSGGGPAGGGGGDRGRGGDGRRAAVVAGLAAGRGGW